MQNLFTFQDRFRSTVPYHLLQLLLLPKAIGIVDLSGELRRDLLQTLVLLNYGKNFLKFFMR